MSLDILQKAAEQRLTLAPVYVPGVLDKHSEWTSPEELERAIFAFNKSGDRKVRLQHRTGTAIGQVESVFVWPWDVETEILSGRGLQKGTKRFPAGTAFAWIRWSPEAWKMVKSGRIRGLSMGGRAERIRVVAKASSERLDMKTLSDDELDARIADLQRAASENPADLFLLEDLQKLKAERARRQRQQPVAKSEEPAFPGLASMSTDELLALQEWCEEDPEAVEKALHRLPRGWGRRLAAGQKIVFSE